MGTKYYLLVTEKLADFLGALALETGLPSYVLVILSLILSDFICRFSGRIFWPDFLALNGRIFLRFGLIFNINFLFVNPR